MATYVAWKPYYSVGDSSLDAEHQQILAAIDGLYAAMSTCEENAKSKETPRSRGPVHAHPFST